MIQKMLSGLLILNVSFTSAVVWSAPPEPSLDQKIDQLISTIGAGGQNQCSPRFANGHASLMIGVSRLGRKTYFSRGSHAQEMTENSVFGIASITKPFTGALLQDLVLQERLNLDAPANDFLPGKPLPEKDGMEITLRHLMTHSSGLPRNSDLNERDPYEGHDLEKVSAFLSKIQMDRKPGQAFQYSNLGFSVLTGILENVSGTRYADLLAERITRPLQMNRTGFLSDDQLVQGYETDGSRAEVWHFHGLYAGGGGIRSTAADMLAYSEAQIQAVLTPSTPTLKALRATQAVQTGYFRNLGSFDPLPLISIQSPDFYDPSVLHLATAWQGRADHPYLQHSGSIAGHTSYFLVDLKTQSAVIVLSNSSGVNGSALCLEKLGRGILDLPPVQSN